MSSTTKESTGASRNRAAGRQKDNKIIHSLDKGLILIEALEQADQPLSLNDLYKKLGWERATIHRLLETLSRRGYVLRHADTKKYSLGLRILSLATSLRNEFDVRVIARPILVKLTKMYGESSHAAIPIGNTMLFIDWVDSEEAVKVTARVGEQAPLHCTAIGKCFLAFDSQLELDARFHGKLESRTPQTITSLEALEADLEKARQRGYATDDEEYFKDVRCVASPVLSEYGTVIAAIGISAPKFRTPLARLHEIGAELVSHALEISSNYGLTEFRVETR